jgi:hypothetical protein
MRTKLRAKKDDHNYQSNSDSATIGNSSSTSTSYSLSSTNNSSSALERRAADMLSNAATGGSGSGNGGVDLSTIGEPKPDAKTLAEIRESTERLASELNEYLSKNDGTTSNNTSSSYSSDSKSSLTDEQIADLQLAVARKLRQVRKCVFFGRCFDNSFIHFFLSTSLTSILLINLFSVASTESRFIIYSTGT